ncbi:MAG: chemotaxis protein [Pirellulales bacterium]
MTQTSTNTLSTLSNLFALATQNASTSMSRWTHGQMSLVLDHVHEIALEDVAEHLNVGEELLTIVVLNLEGEFDGQIILTFDDINGKQLAASLLGQEPSDTSEWTELEKSAISETGNILGCAYMNELTRLLEVSLVPSPPMFIQDYGACVLQQALMAQAMASDQVLLCHTQFHRLGQELDWNVFFVPSESLLERIIQSAELISA